MGISIKDLRSGEQAVIQAIEGGRGIAWRLEALGLRPGKKLAKISAQFLGGPITVCVDGRYVALGRGIAGRVIVKRTEDA
ncbi:MAG: FeoA family protein [Kiritimatiellae bacterium]|nr:FeoA family protein [Kiritimatiellia bacterium]